jgi:hypothetical protein
LCESPSSNSAWIRLFFNSKKHIHDFHAKMYSEINTAIIVAQLILIRWSRTSVPRRVRIALLILSFILLKPHSQGTEVKGSTRAELHQSKNLGKSCWKWWLISFDKFHKTEWDYLTLFI